jgi:hypothetical protein
MIKKTIPFIIVSLFLFLSITLFSIFTVKDRFGLFVSRKGEAELGIVEKDRIIL